MDRPVAVELTAPPSEQTRARYPDESGYVERDGVRSTTRSTAPGEPTVLLLPTWSIIHSRHWKMQIPYLARHCRVLTFDGRGNGRSDRPTEPEAYDEREFAADAVAVLDATATDKAVIVSLSLGAQRALILAAEHPERVEAAVFIGPSYVGGGEALSARTAVRLGRRARHRRGLGEVQQALLAARLPRLPRVLLLPHLHGAALDEADRGLRRLGARDDGRDARHGPRRREPSPEEARELARRVRCPVLVIHGAEDDKSQTRGAALAEHTGGQLVILEGSGHGAARPRPRQGQPAPARVHRAGQAAGAAGSAASRGASGRSTSLRRSGSATPSATPRSPTSCASSIPTSRSTGWRSIR